MGEVVFCAAHIINIMPTRDVQHMTPFEKWYGYKPLLCILKSLILCMGPYSQRKETSYNLQANIAF
jgi:hypothetical protein